MFYFKQKIVPSNEIFDEEEDEFEEELKDYVKSFEEEEEEEKSISISSSFENSKTHEFSLSTNVSFKMFYHLLKFKFNASEELSIFLKRNEKVEILENNWGKIKSENTHIRVEVKETSSDFGVLEPLDTSLLLKFPSTTVFEIEEVKKLIEMDFEFFGVKNVFKRDLEFWSECFENCDVERKGILRRIMVTIKYGGLLYRNHENRWKKYPYPICTTLSHGGRILIQLPMFDLQSMKSLNVQEDQYRNAFWNWILTGDPNKSGIREIVSTRTNSEECRKEGKVVFKRVSSTHTIQDLEKPMNLPFGRKLFICEEKGYSLRMKDTKTNYISSNDYIYSHHKHWGMNVAMGGEGNISLCGERILANGSFGHLYLYHQAPKQFRNGGIMIGFENCEYGFTSQFGEKHGMKGKSLEFTPTFSYKWTRLKQKEKEVPVPINGMLIDLTQIGWEFLIPKEEEWDDSQLGDLIIPLKRITKKKTHRLVEVDDFVVLVDS